MNAACKAAWRNLSKSGSWSFAPQSDVNMKGVFVGVCSLSTKMTYHHFSRFSDHTPNPPPFPTCRSQCALRFSWGLGLRYQITTATHNDTERALEHIGINRASRLPAIHPNIERWVVVANICVRVVEGLVKLIGMREFTASSHSALPPWR